jgi:hypothetical protein
VDGRKQAELWNLEKASTTQSDASYSKKRARSWFRTSGCSEDIA